MSWIKYFWKWLSVASPLPIRIAEIAFFIIMLAGLAAHQLSPTWEPKMISVAWQLPLGLLIATFLISLAVSSYRLYQEEENKIGEQNKKIIELEQQLNVARRQAYPPITTLMMEPFFKDKDIPLGEFGIVNYTLADKTFENCRIHGAAVLFLGNGITMTGCRFSGNPDASFIVTENRIIGGVLSLIKCTFINCDFGNVSFIGNAESMASLKARFNLGGPPKV